MRVAWIGMGQIGRPMALRVLEAGHALVGHARKPERFDDIRQAGGSVTDVVREAVAGAEVVCVNLFSEAQLIEVVIDGGALSCIESGATLVVHSTVGAQAIEGLSNARPDVHVLDAAFSGDASDAANGRISLMVGGEAQALSRVRSVLAAYGDPIVHVGPSGAGMRLKLINNLLFAANLSLAADALRLASASGIDTQTAAGTIGGCSGSSFAMSLFSKAAPQAVLRAVRPYLDKDVATARSVSGALNLGLLDATAKDWG